MVSIYVFTNPDDVSRRPFSWNELGAPSSTLWRNHTQRLESECTPWLWPEHLEHRHWKGTTYSSEMDPLVKQYLWNQGWRLSTQKSSSSKETMRRELAFGLECSHPFRHPLSFFDKYMSSWWRHVYKRDIELQMMIKVLSGWRDTRIDDALARSQPGARLPYHVTCLRISTSTTHGHPFFTQVRFIDNDRTGRIEYTFSRKGNKPSR